MALMLEVTATSLNLRAGPSIAATVIAVLRRGQTCIATGETSDNWLPVIFERFAGYVSANFVQPMSGAAAPIAVSFSPHTAQAVRTTPAPAGSDVETRQRDPAQLHPKFRAVLANLQTKLEQENLPFRVFEAYRTPERQAWLYAQGRTRPGLIVTKAEPWKSFHQYGLAADMVLFIDGQWNWSDKGPLGKHWKRLREIASSASLRSLDWEAPHVEWPITLQDAIGPDMLSAADESWMETLQSSVVRWRSAGGKNAPELVPIERPPLNEQ